VKVNKITTQYTRDRQTWAHIESYPVHCGAQLNVKNDIAFSKDLLATRVGDAWQGYIRHVSSFPIFWLYVLTNDVSASPGI
jgi:hypothetical protein